MEVFMKISAQIVTLVLLFCVVLFAQTNKKSSSPSKHPTSAKTDDCAPDDRKSDYYDFVIRVPHTSRKIHVYNVDGPAPPEPHQPICLSASAKDVMVWRSDHKFKVKISYVSGGDACNAHPFSDEPSSDSSHGWYSGPAKTETVGCVYDVKFQRPGEKESDPHIRITP